MNFYEHHIGDYQKKTAHLSLLEHGAYFLMMQAFYATEKPLPTGKVLYRMLRAASKPERAAIDSIVSQFWQKTAHGLVNSRGNRELAAYRAFLDKQSANGKSGAAKRWAAQRNGGGHGGGDGTGHGGGDSVGHGVGSGDGGSQNMASHLPPPTSHSPSEDLTPKPPLEKGAVRPRRSPQRAERDKALAAWSTVVATEGAVDDPKVREALKAIGGYSRVRLRTVHEEPEIRRAFVEAYVSAAA